MRLEDNNGRTGVVYVHPAGTRDRLLPQKQNWTNPSKEEPEDIGIQGIVEDSNVQSQLDRFRSQIIHAFYVEDTKAGASQPFLTSRKG